MKILSRFLLSFLLLCQYTFVNGQYLDFTEAVNISRAAGDDLFPQWSSDGRKIVFQSNRNGNWDILRYDLKMDSSLLILESEYNEEHPVFINNNKEIVFDSDLSGIKKLYRSSMSGDGVTQLFRRDLESIKASFTPTEKLVYFKGYDPHEKKWWIYSFEFYYENLNKLTKGPWHDDFPVVSADEDRVVFIRDTGTHPSGRIHLMNWYGEGEHQLLDMHAMDPAWDPSGLKIYFISREENRTGDLYSCWIDGSHLEQLTQTEKLIRSPQVSPDGRFMALAIQLDDGYDIFLIPFEDY